MSTQLLPLAIIFCRVIIKKYYRLSLNHFLYFPFLFLGSFASRFPGLRVPSFPGLRVPHFPGLRVPRFSMVSSEISLESITLDDRYEKEGKIDDL